MALSVFNTLTRKKEPFEPLVPGRVGMYVCGPTVYDSCHLGHARHGVVWDMVRRYLEYAGYKVTCVVNITDIDDKIIRRAAETGVSWREVTARYIPEYYEDMTSLRVRRADHQPRATEHIADMIAAVGRLIEKGHAYEVEGSVYFSVESWPDYGRLSGRGLGDDGLARVESDERKRHPADFALWKAAREGEPGWASPWGMGRPGWHIECSVMSARYLGMPFDIHGGGEDLVFPHHENEIAQAEALTGKRFVRYWLHNGFITVREEKMSKSLGNQLVLREILKRYMPSTLRFFFLGSHYRSPVEFSHERLLDAANGLDRVFNCLEALDARKSAPGGEPVGSGESGELAAKASAAREDFVRWMDDDFNTPGAMGAIFDLIGAANAALAGGASGPGLGEAANVIRELVGVLGLPAERERPAEGELEGRLIELLVGVRKEARAARQFAIADRIRDEMKAMGVEIEDMPGGEARVVRRVARAETPAGGAV